ncbi:MAG: IS110 family transposase [Candidatus Eremiobacteraeota bacterium]|nr:IS110 family transposase [Candidatus Eremiobacteraeota bacterium]
MHRAVAVLFPDEVVCDIELPNALGAIRDLDTHLANLATTHNADLVYGLEDHRHYGRWFCQVLSERGRDVRVVNPLWTNRQRAFYGQDKDDAIDGRSIAAVVLRRREQLPSASDFGEVAQAVREAERTIQAMGEARTQLLNRLHQQLSNTYTSAYETFFGKLKSPLALRFFRRFPLPQDLVGQDAGELAAVLLDLAAGQIGPHKGDNRLVVLRAKAETILETAAALCSAQRTLALELKAELIRQLCDELLANHEHLARLERMLRQQLLPASQQTITTIPGIGTVLAAAIIGETGSIRRFRSPAAFAVYNGTAPARNSTGGRDRHKARHDCNHRLKRAFWLAARAAVLHDLLAKEYFDRCKSRGLNYTECIKRVARRMSDLVFALLKSGQPYNRSIIKQAIERRQEQVAHAGGSRVNKALPTPSKDKLRCKSRSYK